MMQMKYTNMYLYMAYLIKFKIKSVELSMAIQVKSHTQFSHRVLSKSHHVP